MHYTTAHYHIACATAPLSRHPNIYHPISNQSCRHQFHGVYQTTHRWAIKQPVWILQYKTNKSTTDIETDSQSHLFTWIISLVATAWTMSSRATCESTHMHPSFWLPQLKISSYHQGWLLPTPGCATRHNTLVGWFRFLVWNMRLCVLICRFVS